MNKILSFACALLLSVVASAQVVPFSISNNCSKNGRNTDITDPYGAVDLGLSVKWASYNVGATAPEEYGDYFAWGEVTPKESYSWENYLHCNGSMTTLTKYCTESDYGIVDNKTRLDAEDDAASVNWGSGWRMPTDAEWSELLNNCTWTLTQENGVNGYRVGASNNSIFLPVVNENRESGYWASASYDPIWGNCYEITSTILDYRPRQRASGYSVRPVRPINVGVPTRCTLSVYADGCDTPNTLYCLPGTEVELTANEDFRGIVFTQWSDGNTDNPRTIIVSDDATYTAQFDTIFYSNVITYTATRKLPETTTLWADGIHPNQFDASISSHTFSNGIGTITFSSEITTIGEDAFSDCSSLTSINIPVGVTTISDRAFYRCTGLTSITIPSSVTSIGQEAFVYCLNLSSINIPEGVTSIGQEAFGYCPNLSSISVKAGNTMYDSRDNSNAIIETATNTLIAGCMNTIIPNSVTSIGQSAFYHCSNLTSITIPENVISIGEGAFLFCSSLTSIIIPEGVTSIGHGTFSSCSSLTSIIIPEGVTSIGDFTFSRCSALSSITLPNTIISIGDDAFNYCTSLTTITIPRNVTSIGMHFLDDCNGLTSIVVLAEEVPTMGYCTYYNVPTTIPVYVPCGSVDAYKAAQYWKRFTNIQELPSCSEETEYTRPTTTNCYGTICLPKAVAHDDIEGGVFFNIVYAVTNTNMDITGILMQEETGDLVAGKPYIFRATADELVLPYTGTAVAEPIAANGLVGNLSETPLDVPQGMYVLSNNQIRKLNGGTATAGQNRAYIDLTNVTKLNYVPAAAPNHVMLNTEDYEITDLENIKSEDVQKIIRDGQLLIIRDGKTYNVLGNSL